MIKVQAEPLKIGWASRDISTAEPVGIRGQNYLRISQKVLDPLSVTALAVDNGKDAVIFLAMDNVCLPKHINKAITGTVAKLAPEVPVRKILMNVTHSHSTGDLFPSRLGFPCDMPRTPGREYADFFVRRAAEAVVEAWKKRTPGGVAWGYGYAVVGHCRRTVYFDDASKRSGATASVPGVMINGHCVMHGNTDDRQFSHFETGSDPHVNLLFTFDSKGGLTGAIINVPCPSQSSGNISMLSADYWHDVRLAIRAKYGDIFILPQCAAAGDISPRILYYKQAQERRFRLKYGRKAEYQGEFARKDSAERIAAAFSEVYSWARKDIRCSLPITHITADIKISKRPVSDAEFKREKEILAELEKTPFAAAGDPAQRQRHDSYLVSKRSRCRSIIRRYEEQKRNPWGDVELHAVRIGDIAFASCPFELYTDYMLRIQARSPFEQTFIVQLANTVDVSGYVPTERAEKNCGYSADYYSSRISSRGGQELVEKTLEILKQIKTNDAKSPCKRRP
ncbi:MAG: hypothetical protein PHV82_06045 [Victivallaceae bacterium]|nr:hypothetical protein [Victivallaceae bacterium]